MLLNWRFNFFRKQRLVFDLMKKIIILVLFISVHFIHAEGGVGVGNGGVLPPPPPGFKWITQNKENAKIRFQYNEVKVEEEKKAEACAEIYSLAKSFYYKLIALELVSASGSFPKTSWLSYLKPQVSATNVERWVQFLNDDWDSLCKNDDLLLGEISANDNKSSSVILVDEKTKHIVVEYTHWTSLRGDQQSPKVEADLYLSFHLYLGFVRLWSSSEVQNKSTPILILEKI